MYDIVFSPCKILMTKNWDSQSEIKKIPSTLPILFLESLKDEIVPNSHMKALRYVFSNVSMIVGNG